MGLEIVRNDDRHTTTCLRTSHSRTHLITEDIGGPSRSDPALKPPITPVYQPKTIDLAVIAWGFHYALPATSFQAPKPGECRMKGEVHLILQIEVCAWQECQQLRHVSLKLTPQISFNQVSDG